MNLLESMHVLNRWFWQDDVWRIILQYMGALYNDFHLDKGLPKLSESRNLHYAFTQTAPEYVTVSGRQICEEKGYGTGRSIRKNEYLSYYINFEWPPLEICQSMWQENCLGELNPCPKRVLFYFDIEYFNHSNPEIMLLDQSRTFCILEPAYQIIKSSLLELGIDHLAIATGRGYNFVCAIPWESYVLSKLITIGGTIEPTVQERHSRPAYKRKTRVSPEAELSFKGIMRLVQFFVGLVIDKIRGYSKPFSVEMSDSGNEGISMDTTMLTRTVDTSSAGIPANLYLKLHFNKDIGNADVVNNTPIPIRLIRSRKNHDNFPDISKMIKVRNDYDQALDHFSGQTGFIPDGSDGINNLINLYWGSPMNLFHNLMDNEEHFSYWEWWKTYRNYDSVIRKFPYFKDIILNANPKFLQPDCLNTVINELLNDGWHPKHVGGFIRAIYDDYRFNWGNRFSKYDSAKWANGWIEVLGSQRYFGLN